MTNTNYTLLDKNKQTITDISEADTIIYHSNLDHFFNLCSDFYNAKNLVPNDKYLNEDKSLYIQNNDKHLCFCCFTDEKVTQVSSKIRTELDKLVPDNHFKDLSNYITLIATELAQNSLIAAQASNRYARFDLFMSSTQYKIVVEDKLGTLTREIVLSKLKRAFTEKSYEEKEQGAGLGLYMVINSCDRIIFDITQPNITKICCIINKYKRLKDFKQKAVALHFLGDR